MRALILWQFKAKRWSLKRCLTYLKKLNLFIVPNNYLLLPNTTPAVHIPLKRHIANGGNRRPLFFWLFWQHLKTFFWGDGRLFVSYFCDLTVVSPLGQSVRCPSLLVLPSHSSYVQLLTTQRRPDRTRLHSECQHGWPKPLLNAKTSESETFCLRRDLMWDVNTSTRGLEGVGWGDALHDKRTILSFWTSRPLLSFETAKYAGVQLWYVWLLCQITDNFSVLCWRTSSWQTGRDRVTQEKTNKQTSKRWRDGRTTPNSEGGLNKQKWYRLFSNYATAQNKNRNTK